MNDEKSLPSGNKKFINDSAQKSLPSSDSISKSNKTLPSRGSLNNGSEFAPNQIVLKQETIDERIHQSTKSGGLKELPTGFKNKDGDWNVILSTNYFKILYLDYKEHKSITKNMVDGNFNIIQNFWKDTKYRYQTAPGAVPQMIETTYGKENIDNALVIIQKAYDALSKPGGVEIYYAELEKNRYRSGLLKIQPQLKLAATSAFLPPATEELLYNMAIEVELTSEEIAKIIEQFLKENNIKRGEFSSVLEETERIFLYQIKKQLKDNLLSIDEEDELKVDLKTYKIPDERFEPLIMHALREVKDCEREYTFEKDKNRFSEFYMSLLIQYGLDDNGNLENIATRELFERDSSLTEFFPLQSTTRANLVLRTKELYLKNLSIQKLEFLSEALNKFQIFHKSGDEIEKLKNSKLFPMVLRKSREELIKKSLAIIRYANVLFLSETSSILYKEANWKLNEAARSVLVNTPHKIVLKTPVTIRVNITEKLLAPDPILDESVDLRMLYNITVNQSAENIDLVDEEINEDKSIVRIKPDFNYIDSDTRKKILSTVEIWALSEYEYEKKYFTASHEEMVKKQRFGLSVPNQNLLENSTDFHLTKTERRSIITELEKPLRLKAEKEFIDIVRSKVGVNTIIPVLANYLEELNDKSYFLSPQKNEISFPVKPFREIISGNTEPYENALRKVIQKLKKEYQIEPFLIKKYNLKDNAGISKTDLLNEIRNFHTENEEQLLSVFLDIKIKAESEKFFVIEASDESEIMFFNVFNEAVELSSKKYTLKEDKWLTDSFKKDLVKVGAMYGLSSENVIKHIEEYKPKYKIFTKPRWKDFYELLIKIVVPLFLIRLWLSVSYPDWIFLENSGAGEKIVGFLDYLTCVSPLIPSFSWALFAIILFTPFAFSKAVKGLLTSFKNTKRNLFVASLTIVLIISTISIIVSGSDSIRQAFIEKAKQNASDYESKGEYTLAINEFNKALFLAVEGRSKYYIQRGNIYSKKLLELYKSNQQMHSVSDEAIKDYSLGIEMEPNNAEYYILRGNYYFEKASLFNDLDEYSLARDDYYKASQINQNSAQHSSFDYNGKINIIDSAVRVLKKNMAVQKKRVLYQEAGIIPDYKIIADNVSLKSNHSTFAGSVKTLKRFEEVKKIDSWVSKESDMVEVAEDVNLMKNGNPANIPAGSLVKIIGKVESYYIVSYKTKKSEVTGKVAVSSTRNISEVEWIKIKSLHGSVGWIRKSEVSPL